LKNLAQLGFSAKINRGLILQFNDMAFIIMIRKNQKSPLMAKGDFLKSVNLISVPLYRRLLRVSSLSLLLPLC